MINLVVIIVMMLITSLLVFGFLGNYLVGERSQALSDEAERINDMTLYYIENKSQSVENVYKMVIENAAKRIRGTVFIVDKAGEVIMSNNARTNMNVDKINPQNLIVDDKTVTVGNMDGLFSEDYLVVATPLTYHDEVAGATFLAVPAPEINKMKYGIFKIYILAAFAATVLAMVLSYFYSRRVSKPIKQLGKAAQSVANGNFDVQVDQSGNDEIANLSANFNLMVLSLKELEDMRQSFISSVSHELRTPMTTIAGFIDGILDNTIPKESQEKYLKIISDEVKRLSRLVSQLLDLARIDAGTTPPLKFKEFDINELIRITILRYEKALTEKNIDVNIDFDDEKTVVSADKDAVARVLNNLFDNAIKFNYRGGYIKIRVKAQAQKAVISVENSGIGISKEELRHIWERFYKTDKSRAYDKNGMGLGLYMVHNIIKMHGEKIWAESEKEKWARFTFTLKKLY